MANQYFLNNQQVMPISSSELNCDNDLNFLTRFNHGGGVDGVWNYALPPPAAAGPPGRFYIGVLTSPKSGFGDLFYGIKFTRQLLIRYPDEVGVCLLLPSINPAYLSQAQIALEQFKPATFDGTRTATAIYDFDPDEAEHLAFNAGDRLVAVRCNGFGWWDGTNERTKKVGIFPPNYVQLDESPLPHEKFKRLNFFTMTRETEVQFNTLELVDILVAEYVPAHIVFIAPGTNIRRWKITLPYLPNINLEDQYVHVMSEYNTSSKLMQDAAVTLDEVTINAGVYNWDDCITANALQQNVCPTGVFLSEDREYRRLGWTVQLPPPPPCGPGGKKEKKAAGGGGGGAKASKAVAKSGAKAAKGKKEKKAAGGGAVLPDKSMSLLAPKDIVYYVPGGPMTLPDMLTKKWRDNEPCEVVSINKVEKRVTVKALHPSGGAYRGEAYVKLSQISKTRWTTDQALLAIQAGTPTSGDGDVAMADTSGGGFMPAVGGGGGGGGAVVESLGYYAATYFYTSSENVNDLYRPEYDIAFPDEALRQVRDGSEKNEHRDSNCERQSYKWRVSMMVLSDCMLNFLGEVNTWRKDNVVNPNEKIDIYLGEGQLTDFRKFIVLEDTAKMRKLNQWLSGPKTPFSFKIRRSMQPIEMLQWFQHAIPIAFLSGDQTPIEFISVNHSKTIKLQYSAFYWKRALAVALGAKNMTLNSLAACGMMTIDREKFLRNIGNNFGITGMAQVDLLLARRLVPPIYEALGNFSVPQSEQMGSWGFRPSDSVLSFEKGDRISLAVAPDGLAPLRGAGWLFGQLTGEPRLRPGWFSSHFIGVRVGVAAIPCQNKDKRTIATRIKDVNHFVYKVNERLMSLEFEIKDNTFNTNLIQGDKTVPSVRGSIMTFLTSFTKQGPEDIFVKFLECASSAELRGNCNKFVFNLGEKTKNGIYQIPVCLNATIVNRYLNTVRQEIPVIKDMLVETYATVISHCGQGKLLTQVNIEGRGLFILQEFDQGATILAEVFKSAKISSQDLILIFAQIYIVLINLQEKYKLVHNDLWSANILTTDEGEKNRKKFTILGKEFTSRYTIKLIDFDNASFEIKPDIRVISKEGYDYKSSEYKEYFDFVYLFADLLTMCDTLRQQDRGVKNNARRVEYKLIVDECINAMLGDKEKYIRAPKNMNAGLETLHGVENKGQMAALGKYLKGRV